MSGANVIPSGPIGPDTAAGILRSIADGIDNKVMISNPIGPDGLRHIANMLDELQPLKRERDRLTQQANDLRMRLQDKGEP